MPALRPSILDWLTGRIGGARRGQLSTSVQKNVGQDLEDLLNTRSRCFTPPPELDELRVSLVNYGIPDFSSVSLGSAESREEFRRNIQRAIEDFEPRLRNVRVEERKAEPGDRTLRYRISAVLESEEITEPIVFDSELEPVSASFSVKGSHR
jgi:type VI secretion system protein ImpF